MIKKTVHATSAAEAYALASSLSTNNYRVTEWNSFSHTFKLPKKTLGEVSTCRDVHRRFQQQDACRPTLGTGKSVFSRKVLDLRASSSCFAHPVPCNRGHVSHLGRFFQAARTTYYKTYIVRGINHPPSACIYLYGPKIHCPICAQD